MKKMMVLLLALACMTAAFCPALGEQRAFAYGGSKDDSLRYMAVSQDGRIVMTGYTNSHDGTLKGRTKKGRSGWALCVDADGEVLWSFCSRLGTHDTMTYPVFHEDGSVTVLLEAETQETQEIELIRLDERGEVVMRKTLLKEKIDKAYIRPSVWHTDQGYVLIYDKRGAHEGEAYRLYGFDGAQKVFEPSVPGVRATAGGFAVQIEDGQGWLCRMDKIGATQRLAHVFDVQEDGFLLGGVNALLALNDGGAVGGGFVTEDPTQRRTSNVRLTRWNAQGVVVFDSVTDAGRIDSIARIPGGYAATVYQLEESPMDEIEWALVRFDEAGNITQKEPFDMQSISSYDIPIAVLPDGSVVAVGVTGELGSARDGQMIRFLP